MKSKILGSLAVALLAGPMAADAYIVTIAGGGTADGQWNVSTVVGAVNNPSFLAILDDQVWWGSPALASIFGAAAGANLGFPNTFGSAAWGPIFAYDINTGYLASQASPGTLATIINTNEADRALVWTYATAARLVPEPVPLPAAAWLLLSGLGGLGFMGRRKA